ncbi:MAG: Smr/MutS family protein [Patescibacteria group bacterium]
MSYYADKGNKYPQNPELVLDFHGYTTMECKEELDELIGNSEYSHIRIIVGKGQNSANGPILPDFVRNYLTTRNIRFNQSKIQAGGAGALEVFLD